MLTIRPLIASDVEAVVELWKACELTRPWNDPYQDIEMAAGKDCSEVLVGLVDDRVVASAMVGFDGHRGWVYYVGVHPDCRGRGFGRAIMEAAEAWISERGPRKILLLVRETNLGVLDFYEQLGYQKDPVVALSKIIAPG